MKNIELRVSTVSKYNIAFITRYIKNSTIFPSLSNIEKEVILQNLLSINLIILSLFTFYKDTKYLKPCVKAIKILIKPRG